MTRLALLFDLDGTLIDSIDLLVECMDHAFAGRPGGPTRDQWIAGIGTPLRRQLADWADDDAMIEDLVSRYREHQDAHLERLTTAFEGVPELLNWARTREHALGIVTSKGRGMTDRSLAHVGLAHAFDIVVTVEATERHKPHPDPVLHALDVLGFAPGRALFAGDSPHDMLAGRAAGVRTVACEWGPFTREQLDVGTPDFRAGSVPQLREIISLVERSNPSPSRPVQSGVFNGKHARFAGDRSDP
jgi:pyrophosphatase PpaX